VLDDTLIPQQGQVVGHRRRLTIERAYNPWRVAKSITGDGRAHCNVGMPIGSRACHIPEVLE
jgi:hypothetical protein